MFRFVNVRTLVIRTLCVTTADNADTLRFGIPCAAQFCLSSIFASYVFFDVLPYYWQLFGGHGGDCRTVIRA